jgi:predicted MPP superfamily phosphohydrolase
MPVFLFIVFVFGSANIYFFLKLSLFLNSGTLTDIPLGLIILIMYISPVLLPIYSHRGSEKTLRIFSYISYMWLAFLVPFFPSAVVLELYNFIAQHSSDLIGRDLSTVMISPDNTFLIPIFISLAANAYGYVEATNLRIERLTIKSPKLPDGVSNVRVAQISDLHLGLIVGDKILNRVIEKINAENPDLIVSTGDLIDGVVRHINHLGEKLKNLHAPFGKFAVIGNHEIYGGIQHAEEFIQDAGFKLLRGKGITIKKTINIAGMDFSGGETHRFSRASVQKPEKDILVDLPDDLFTLLLKHRSDVKKDSIGLFDLQLSGHTHKGQIFPMSLATMFLFKYHTGFTKLRQGSAIYVSRGTGTAGPPIRFLSTPEITVIDIVREKAP